jgi:V/A-type H+/Na+-transporting ATPase subunit E
MKGLETGKDKIQKICDILKSETLEPAKQEAREIVENAHLQAAEIVKEAQAKAELIRKAANQEMDEKGKVFQASLQIACRQGLELLKQKIEEKLFDQQLSELVLKEMAEPNFVAHLIDSFMKSMQEKGIEEEFIAVIPKSISPRSINLLLGEQILEKIQKQTVVVGDFAGGVQIRMKERQITIDITDATVRELIAGYIRRDFREMIFNV